MKRKQRTSDRDARPVVRRQVMCAIAECMRAGEFEAITPTGPGFLCVTHYAQAERKKEEGDR